MVILLPLAESFKKGCHQLQVKVCARHMLSTYTPYRGRKYFAVWKDQGIICCHSACKSDSQFSIHLYRRSEILVPGTGTAWKK